mgnify:CR=1 FL=1
MFLLQEFLNLLILATDPLVMAVADQLVEAVDEVHETGHFFITCPVSRRDAEGPARSESL